MLILPCDLLGYGKERPVMHIWIFKFAKLKQ